MLLIRCHLNQQVKLFCSLHIWSFLLLILTKKKKKMSRNPSKLDRELSFLLLIYLVHAHVRRGGGTVPFCQNLEVYSGSITYIFLLCVSPNHTPYLITQRVALNIHTKTYEIKYFYYYCVLYQRLLLSKLKVYNK
jgi:hypothetical protein